MQTTATVTMQALLRHAASRGVPAALISGWAGVPADDLRGPGRLPVPSLLRAWVLLRDELADPLIAPRATREWTLADFGLFGFCLISAPTVRIALEAAARNIRLLTDRGEWKLIDDGAFVRCVWSWFGPLTDDHALANEIMVAAFARGVEELSGCVPVRIELMHRAPAPHGGYEPLLGCPVRFECDENMVLVEREHMELAPRSANPALFRFLGELAAQHRGELAPKAIGDRASRFVAERLAIDARLPAISAVARNLGMSERTLRRRLEEEGTSFRVIRDAARIERASALIGRRGLSLAEIASESGFSDATAFSRAWKRIRGVAPSRSVLRARR